VPSEKRFVRRQQFTAIFGGAKLGVMRYLKGYDIFYYEPTKDFGFELPKSFQGTSGAIWRFYVKEENNQINVVDRRLIGIPYYEDITPRGTREIVCHGPKASMTR